MAQLQLLSVADLLAAPEPEQTLTIAGLPGAIRIRAISKAEAMRVHREAQVGQPDGSTVFDGALWEQGMVQAALASPALTRDEVAALWLKPLSVVQPLVNAILRFNRYDEGAVEATEDEFRS